LVKHKEKTAGQKNRSNKRKKMFLYSFLSSGAQRKRALEKKKIEKNGRRRKREMRGGCLNFLI